MSTHTAYRVLEAQFLHQLEIDVNAAIGKGWQCAGGVMVSPNGWPMQAMVKPAEIDIVTSHVYNRVVAEGDTAQLVRDGGGA